MSAAAEEAVHGPFHSLLGALGLAEVGRVDACVNVAALQRAKTITNRDALALNVLLRYLRKQPAHLLYVRPTELLALISVSVSAYKWEVSGSRETDGLAMRGAVSLRIERRDQHSPGGRFQLFDLSSK